jgi:hypothetical protein
MGDVPQTEETLVSSRDDGRVRLDADADHKVNIPGRYTRLIVEPLVRSSEGVARLHRHHRSHTDTVVASHT